MAESIARYGYRVRLNADKGEQAPAGLWRCVDRSPHGPGSWWLQPADQEAWDWLARPHCPVRLHQGCISWPSRLMRPPDAALLF